MPESLKDNAAIDWPGAALGVISEILAASGFDTRRSGGEESRTLAVTGLRDVACEITADDDGCFRSEYYPRGCDDPDQMAGRVMRLLAGTSPPPPGGAQTRPVAGTGLKGLVGCRLRACGMAVSLEVYEDHMARPGRGRVLVSVDGAGASSPDTREVAESIRLAL